MIHTKKRAIAAAVELVGSLDLGLLPKRAPKNGARVEVAIVSVVAVVRHKTTVCHP